MLDNNPSVGLMKAYGYTWEGMVPLSYANARKLYLEGKVSIFKLYPDDSESYIDSLEDLEAWDGMFGVEKEDV